MKDQVKEMDDIRRRGLWGLSFIYNTKFLSFGGTQNLYWKRVLGDFRGFIWIFQIQSMLLYLLRPYLVPLTSDMEAKWCKLWRKEKLLDSLGLCGFSRCSLLPHSNNKKGKIGLKFSVIHALEFLRAIITTLIMFVIIFFLFVVFATK